MQDPKPLVQIEQELDDTHTSSRRSFIKKLVLGASIGTAALIGGVGIFELGAIGQMKEDRIPYSFVDLEILDKNPNAYEGKPLITVGFPKIFRRAIAVSDSGRESVAYQLLKKDRTPSKIYFVEPLSYDIFEESNIVNVRGFLEPGNGSYSPQDANYLYSHKTTKT